MYVNINGKLIELTQEEYDAFIETQICSCTSNCKPRQLNKMEKLIDAVESIADAINISSAAVKYHLEKDGDSIKLVGTDGSISSVIDQDLNTSYNISINDRTITMRGTDNSTQSIELPEDKNTKYDISFDPNEDKISLNPSDGEGETTNIDISKFADDTDIENLINNTATEDDLDNLFNH